MTDRIYHSRYDIHKQEFVLDLKSFLKNNFDKEKYDSEQSDDFYKGLKDL